MTDAIELLLVSQDGPLAREIAAQLAERDAAFTVRTAGEPEQARSMAAERPIDCAVSADPATSETGSEFLRVLREDDPALPVILFPEETSDRLVTAALEVGVTDYVPRTPGESQVSLLAERIRQAVERHRVLERSGELQRINRVIRDIDRALVHSTTRAEIDQRVCDIFSRSDPYRFAWIGEYEPASDTVTPRASAGFEMAYLEKIEITTGDEPTAQGPTGRAVEAGEMQVMQNIPEDPDYEPWREQALERGYKSSAAIPLTYEGRLYGVLNLYADRTEAFDESERMVLTELGDDIAQAHYRADVRARQERSERIIENLPVGVYRATAVGDGEFVEANAALAEMLGVDSTEALLEYTVRDFYRDPAERTELRRELEAEGRVRDRELRLETLAGEEIVAAVTAMRTETEGVAYFDGIIQDVTERKAREQRIESLTETLQTIRTVNERLVRAENREATVEDVVATLADHGSFNCCFLALLEDGAVTHVSTAGVASAALARDIHTEAYVEEVLEDDVLWIADVTDPPYRHHPGDVQSHGAVALPLRTPSRDFGILTIHFQPGESPTDEELDMLGELGADIASALRGLELAAELEEREQQYAAVVQNVHDVIVIVQGDEIEFVNDRVTEMVGYTPEELLGRSPAEFVVEEDRELLQQRYRERIEGEGPPESYEVEIVSKAGEPVPVELGISRFEYEGEPATITSIRDLSEQVERTRHLRVLDRVLRHNFHNDMTVIQGYAETLRDDLEGDLAADVDQIIATSEDLVRTVDKEREIVELLADPPARNAIDVADLAERVGTAVQEDYPEAAVDLDLPAEAEAIAVADLERALEELTRNAVVHNDREEPRVSLTVERTADAVTVSVADDGPGIADEEIGVLTREREIEPLFHGSGLGLWLVNWVVKRSNGTIRFEENEPRGSVVTIELEAVA